MSFLDTPHALDTTASEPASVPLAPPGCLPLFALAMGERGVIESLHTPIEAADREVLLRMIELGFLPGEQVRVVARARAGAEPIAVRLGGQSTFALRQREAALVAVRPLAGQDAPA